MSTMPRILLQHSSERIGGRKPSARQSRTVELDLPFFARSAVEFLVSCCIVDEVLGCRIPG